MAVLHHGLFNFTVFFYVSYGWWDFHIRKKKILTLAGPFHKVFNFLT